MRRLAAVAIALVACGGASSPPAKPAAPAVERLPWEAALTVGATFTLDDEHGGEGEESLPLVIKVTGVEDKGSERVYTLDWGEAGNGPSKITVRGSVVLLGDAEVDGMQSPFVQPQLQVTCYGEDFSNPNGCEDVCDAHLCMNESGIVTVDGLYAPGYGSYAVR